MKTVNQLFLIFFIGLGIQSCTERYFTEEGISGIYVQTDSNSKIIGQDLTISVKTEAGEDITDEAVIYVNDEVLPSANFNTDEIGIVSIKAEYRNIESAVVQVEYHDGSQTNFKKRVLVEDYTGTWCGWCPRVSYGMKLLSEQTDASVFVAIHRAPAGLQDPYIYEDADELEVLINTPGYPKGFLNRLTQWEFPEPDNLSQAIALTQGANPKLGLKMASVVESNQITLNVEALFANDFDNLKLIVYLLENGLKYDQVNYTSYFGGENPIDDYEHNHTLRQTLTNIIGDDVDSSESKRGLEFSRTFSLEVPGTIEDISQVDFVAFFTDAEGHVINVRKSSLGETQDYELLE